VTEVTARDRPGGYHEDVIKVEDLIASKRPEERATLDRPLNHLVACHRRIEDRLATLELAASRLIDQPAEAIQAIQGCLRFFDTNGVMHTADEEDSLFPRLASGLSDEERVYLYGLKSQHIQAEAAYDALKRALANLRAAPRLTLHVVAGFSARVADLCAIYREHISSEDARLPALGARILSEADQAAIAAEMKRRRGL